MTEVYNKLVRDGIPDIIAQQGDTPKVVALDDAAFYAALNEKLKEEVAEYFADYSIDELADIAEVILAIAKHQGVSESDFNQLRVKKHSERGGFDKKLMLLAVARGLQE